jgi:hypothetical protein
MKNRLKTLSAAVVSLILLSSFTFSPGDIRFADDNTKKEKVTAVINRDSVEHITEKHDIDFDTIEERIDSILESMDIQIDNIGKTIVIAINDSTHLLKFDEMETSLAKLPPLPPMPPLPTCIKIKKRDRYSFDPDDEDIISYDKKDLSNGREKIVIIRKKK